MIAYKLEKETVLVRHIQTYVYDTNINNIIKMAFN